MKPKKGTAIPVRLSEAIKAEVEAAAAETGFSQQDILRKATELGLPIIRRAMAAALSEARGETPQPA